MAFSKLAPPRTLLSLPILMILSCNCTMLNPSHEKAQETPVVTANDSSQVNHQTGQDVDKDVPEQIRVQKTLQAEVLAAAAQVEGWQQFYALFSQSSYVDRGQLWVYVGENSTQVLALKPGERLLSEAKVLASAGSDVQALLDFLKAHPDLADYDSNAFDGMQFEFVQATKEGSQIKIIKRIFMNNPRETSPYAELIQDFYSLMP